MGAMTDDRETDAPAGEKPKRASWRDAPREERAAAYEDDVARKFWRPRLPMPWRVRGSKARQRDWGRMRSWAESSWDAVRPQRLGSDVVSGALKGSEARERRLLDEEASIAEERFEHMRLVAGVLWACLVMVLGAVVIASDDFFGVAGAIGGLLMSMALPVLVVRADWALVRLRTGRMDGLLEYVRIRLGGGS